MFKRVKVYFCEHLVRSFKEKIAERNSLKEDLRQKFELGCMSFSQKDRSSLIPMGNTSGHWLTLLESDPCKNFNEVSNLVSVSNVFNEIWPFWEKFELAQLIDGFDYGVIGIP